MKINFLIVLLLLFINTTAQDSTRSIKLKSYWSSEVITDDFLSELNSFLSFGVELKSMENNFHEIELKELKISSLINAFGSKSEISLALNYEYNVRFFKKSNKINYYLGIGASPYFSSGRLAPSSSTNFNSYKSIRGLVFNLIPRVKFRLNKKLGFEIKIPLGLETVESYTIINNDPTIPVEYRKYSNSFSNFLLGTGGESHSRVSFGISYKI